MPLNVSAPFRRGGAFPIDKDLVKTKAEMLAVVDNVMPSDYFCLCSDDGKIYIYRKSNTVDETTGKYRLFEGGDASVELTQAQYDALPQEAKMSGTTYYITDGQSGGAVVRSLTLLWNQPAVVGATNPISFDIDKYDALLFEAYGTSGGEEKRGLAVVEVSVSELKGNKNGDNQMYNSVYLEAYNPGVLPETYYKLGVSFTYNASGINVTRKVEGNWTSNYTPTLQKIWGVKYTATGSGGGGASEDAITAVANRGWKNFIPYKILKGGTSGGISASFPEYILENTETLQVNGQASTDVNIVISERFELNKGNYILSGLENSYWADAGANTYYLELVSSGTVIATYPQNPEFSLEYWNNNLELRFVVKAMPNDKWFDSDADGSIIFPMIRDASISDPTYVAPSLGLRELSELIKKKATGAQADIRGSDSSIRVANISNREVSINADTSSKKITVTSAKSGETPQRFEFGIKSAYGIIEPSVSGFGGSIRYQSKNGYATITGTLINSTVPLTQRTETKFAELPATLKPTYEINVPISHHDQTMASTLRIKSNGDLCIYPPTNIPQGTAMFMCVTYPIEN